MLFVELANADQFLLHQRNFLVFRLFLRRQARDLLVQLRDPLAQLRLLSGPSIDTNLEQLGLARDDGLYIGVLGPRERHMRKYDVVEAPLFGLQSRGPRPQPVEVFGDDRKTRLGNGVIEPHDNVAGLDDIAISRADLADHAAGRMLYFFHVGFDDNRSRRDQRPRDLRRRCPAAKPAGKNDDHRQADVQMQPYRLQRSLLLAAAHDLATPPSDTILMGLGGATRCSTCPNTVSLGPNACMRPSFNTSN